LAGAVDVTQSGRKVPVRRVFGKYGYIKKKKKKKKEKRGEEKKKKKKEKGGLATRCYLV